MKHIALRRPRLSAPRLTAALFALSCVAAAAVGARALLKGSHSPAASFGGPTSAARQTAHAPSRRNLSLYPEAAALGRRLGRRFRSAGREVSVSTGTLTADGVSRQVRVVRVQDEQGERVEVALGGGQLRLTWDARRGAVSEAGAAADDLALAERIALDSAEQFVLAQLRGARYHVVARNVRLIDDGGADGYSGPLYDVVQVSEPPREGMPGASTRRLYYLDSRTGLPARVVSEGGGQEVIADLSGWAERDGEWHPSQIIWTRGGGPLMELSLQQITHGPRQ